MENEKTTAQTTPKEKKKQNVISVRCTPEYYAAVRQLRAAGHYKSVPELVNALLREAMLREGIKTTTTKATTTPASEAKPEEKPEATATA